MSFWNDIIEGKFDVVCGYNINGVLCKIVADLLLFEKKYDIAYKYYSLLLSDPIFDKIKSFMYGEIGRFLEINNAVFHDSNESKIITPFILYEKGCEFNDSYAYFCLGNYYGKKGDYEEMRKMHEKSESLGCALAINFLGNYYYVEEDIEKALSYYFKAIANGQEVGYYNCGNVYMDLKDYDKAYKYYKDGHDAGCEYCMYGIIKYYHARGDPMSAVGCLGYYDVESPYYCRTRKRAGDMFRDMYENFENYKKYFEDHHSCNYLQFFESLACVFYKIALLHIDADKNLVNDNIFMTNIDETDIVNWIEKRGKKCMKYANKEIKNWMPKAYTKNKNRTP